MLVDNIKNAVTIKTLLAGKSCTFAQVDYCTEVKTAAKYKHVKIEKLTTANVQLFSDIKTATDVFKNAVQKTALKLGEDMQQIQAFETSSNYFEHVPECYSIVKHKEKLCFYLWAIFNHAKSFYLIDGQPASKDEVSQYLTPSAAKELLNPSRITYNVKNDLQHTVKIRTIKLDNILKIKAAGQTIEL